MVTVVLATTASIARSSTREAKTSARVWSQRVGGGPAPGGPCTSSKLKRPLHWAPLMRTMAAARLRARRRFGAAHGLLWPDVLGGRLGPSVRGPSLRRGPRPPRRPRLTRQAQHRPLLSPTRSRPRYGEVADSLLASASEALRGAPRRRHAPSQRRPYFRVGPLARPRHTKLLGRRVAARAAGRRVGPAWLLRHGPSREQVVCPTPRGIQKSGDGAFPSGRA